MTAVLRRVLPALLLAVALSACSGDKPEPSAPTPTPTPETVVIDVAAVDSDTRERVRVAAVATGAEFGVDVDVDYVPGAPERTIVVTSDAGGFIAPADEATVRYWAAFAPYWSERDALDLDALAPGVTIYAPEEYRHGAEQMLGKAAFRMTRWLPADSVAGAVANDSNGVALLPVESAEPWLRSLSVNGTDFVRGDTPVVGLRTIEKLYIGWSDESLDAFGHALARRLDTPPPAVIRVVATGDIIPSRCVYERQLRRNDFTAAFHATADYLRAADLTLGSLDASLSDAGRPALCEQTLNLLSPARSVEGLAFAGIDVVTVATNHIKDCGSTVAACNQAFLDTLANLHGAGIEYAGGGEDREGAHKPAIVERKGVRIAVLGYDDIASSHLGAGETTPGTAALQAGVLADDIAAARKQADIVIVMCQWGVEYTPNPSERQRAFAREAIDAGAALVVGNHPHVVQAVEWRGEGFVTYALGNFVFDQDWSTETQQGAVLEASFIGTRLVAVRLLPTRIADMYQPTWASPAEARAIMLRIRAATDALR